MCDFLVGVRRCRGVGAYVVVGVRSIVGVREMPGIYLELCEGCDGLHIVWVPNGRAPSLPGECPKCGEMTYQIVPALSLMQ